MAVFLHFIKLCKQVIKAHIYQDPTNFSSSLLYPYAVMQCLGSAGCVIALWPSVGFRVNLLMQRFAVAVGLQNAGWCCSRIFWQNLVSAYS